VRILVLDDQRSARRVIKTILSELPEVDVLEAGTVNEALGLLEDVPRPI